MKIQIRLILFLAAVAIQIIQNDAVRPRRQSQSLIETTCKNTPNYKLCIAIIRADPTSPTKELPDLALIVVAHIKKTTLKTLATIDKLEKSSRKEAAAPLRKCKEAYQAVLEADVAVAERATWGDPKFAETAMADTKIETSVCEDGFKGVAPSPLTAENKYMEDVASVARGIIRNLL